MNNTEERNILAKNLAYYRTFCGLTQKELGKKLQITAQQISKYEKGLNNIPSSRLWQIAKILNIKISSFYKNMNSGNTKMTKKYEFTGEEKEIDGILFRQIRAVKDFGDVKAGDLGGWIVDESIVSQDDESWVEEIQKF